MQRKATLSVHISHFGSVSEAQLTTFPSQIDDLHMGSSTKSNLFCEIQPILYLGFASFDQIFQTLGFMGVLVFLFLGSRNGGSEASSGKLKI